MPDNDRSNLIHVAAWGLLLVVLVGTITAAFLKTSPPIPSSIAVASRGPEILFNAPAFELTERSGQPFSSRELSGHVWIADFVFTSCAGPCPAMTRSMADLQKRFTGAKNMRFVSFSVDPDRDTPAVLRAYATRYGADPSRWFFLTGDASKIYKLALDGFHVLARRATTQELEQPDTQPILHSPYFFLVDKRGRVRGTYDGTDAERMTALERDARKLLKAGD